MTTAITTGTATPSDAIAANSAIAIGPSLPTTLASEIDSPAAITRRCSWGLPADENRDPERPDRRSAVERAHPAGRRPRRVAGTWTLPPTPGGQYEERRRAKTPSGSTSTLRDRCPRPSVRAHLRSRASRGRPPGSRGTSRLRRAPVPAAVDPDEDQDHDDDPGRIERHPDRDRQHRPDRLPKGGCHVVASASPEASRFCVSARRLQFSSRGRSASDIDAIGRSVRCFFGAVGAGLRASVHPSGDRRLVALVARRRSSDGRRARRAGTAGRRRRPRTRAGSDSRRRCRGASSGGRRRSGGGAGRAASRA